MEIYPEKYEQLELTANEKSFMRTLGRALDGVAPCYYVLHINPRKKDAGNGEPELFNLLVCDSGVLLFQFNEKINNSFAAKILISQMAENHIFDRLDNDLHDRLVQSKHLITNSGELIFHCNICFVFPCIEREQTINLLNAESKNFCEHHVIFQDDIQKIRKDGSKILLKYLNRRNSIKEDSVNKIFQRLCPEITIPRKFILEDNAKTSTSDAGIDGSDRSVLSYRLDNTQINIINKIKKGDQLILACAGSGKSVLLISKCFKLASLNPSEKFLITCYNRNLNNYYQWAIAQAGFLNANANVKCRTFLGLISDLLETNNIQKPTSTKDTEDYYNELFRIANDALAKGKIRERFTGIFIDEIQIFKPQWYQFCFNLLKNKDPEHHFFIIAGDKSQDIKNNIKRGKAPWQGGGANFPEYRGKTLPIEINYRNSKPINDAVDRFVEEAKKVGTTIGADLNSDPELFLRGTAVRPGNPPILIELKDFSNEGEATAICDAVKDLAENKGLSEVDIAIILYNRSGNNIGKGWRTNYYNILPYIKSRFYRERWEDPAILIQGESDGVTYGSRRGVTITTIEGSLGLDFRAVVLAGLRPLGNHEGIRTLTDCLNANEEKLEAYKKNVNFIYTGCTRAKDELTIVLSAKKGESIYLDLIRDSIGVID